MGEFHGCNACGSPENWEKLLKEAHDLMDDLNASDKNPGIWCYWCGESGYDMTGLKHKDDCILVRIRQVINA